MLRVKGTWEFLYYFYDSELFQNLRRKEEKEGREGGREQGGRKEGRKERPKGGREGHRYTGRYGVFQTRLSDHRDPGAKTGVSCLTWEAVMNWMSTDLWSYTDLGANHCASHKLSSK